MTQAGFPFECFAVLNFQNVGKGKCICFDHGHENPGGGIKVI